MKRIPNIILIFLAVLFTHGILSAKDAANRTGDIVKGVQAEGACAIVGMSAEPSQLAALQRARAAAIEQAAGNAGAGNRADAR
ncbi:MAG: hypothetical protein JW943_10925 [Deltaproteobacteria bacterium]|nr:hypothetical protein [Deltaproteobacteria bacterium]